jgi:cbb3-type cytochrome oxidase subunit 3
VTALLEEYFVVILLVLFAGVLFWAFRPRKKPGNHIIDGNSSDFDEERR